MAKKRKNRSSTKRKAPRAAKSPPRSTSPRTVAAGTPAGAPSGPPRALLEGLGARALVPLALALLGVVLTAYLTLTKLTSAELAYCGAESSCDLVQSSHYATLLGVPLAAWGLATYALIAGFVWRSRTRPAAWRKAMFVAIVGIAISLYLTAISVFEIGATCGYCLASAALITVLGIALALWRPGNLPNFRWKVWGPGAALWAAVVVVALHLHFSGVFSPKAGPERPYLKALAVHLEETGAKFYGAYWCPRCKEQKDLFGPSAERLPYVECAPGGPNGARTRTCTALNIGNYPTWIVDGQRHVGVREPETLARLSRFNWEGPKQ